jgi:serine/threonine protein kinase
MNVSLNCTNGHSWDLSQQELASGVARTCPVCGAVSRENPAAPNDAADPRGVETLPLPANTPRNISAAANVTPEIDPRHIETLVGPPGETPIDAPELPNVPGYKILGMLGRGGVGVVYKATQIALKREVALKMLLRAEHADSGSLTRFRTEAEAVARLQHPHIVQIYDVGAAGGCPYLALEYLSGGSLSKRLAGKPQPPQAAAEMLRTLAEAVSFAHQRNVLHRDLKPDNVLLAEDGTLKIADFGLAKQLGSEVTPTMTGDIMGTPAYMAPEQASGATRELGPPCDVYALGVILYEMLTGRPPLQGPDVVRTVMAVLHEEPVPPRRLQSGIPRDLETICLKCLEKSPRKRYESAQELADDLKRFLHNEPISARPTRSWERAAKWARRRPAAALAIAVACVLPVLALTAGAWHVEQLSKELRRTEEQRQRAEADLVTAQQALDGFFERMSNQGLTATASREQIQREMLEVTLKFCQGLLVQNPTDPGVRWRTGKAHMLVAGVYHILERYNEAEVEYQQAIQNLADLIRDQPGNRDQPLFRRDLAGARNNLGNLLAVQGKLKQAEESFRLALETNETLVRESQGKKDQIEFQSPLATNHNNLGALYRKLGRLADAEKSFREAQRIFALLADTTPLDANYRLSLAMAYNNLAAVAGLQSKVKEADESFAAAIQVFEQLHREFPQVINFRLKLADTENNRALFLASHARSKEAAEAFDHARRVFEEGPVEGLAGLDRDQGLAVSLDGLAALALQSNEPDQAEKWAEQALAVLKKIAGQHSERADFRSQLAMAQEMAGRIQLVRGKLPEARRYLNEAVASQQMALAGEPESRVQRVKLRYIYESLATLLLLQGEPGEAAKLAEEFPRLLPDEADEYRRAAELLGRCFAMAQSIKSLDFAADVAARRALQLLEEGASKGPLDIAGLQQSRDLKPFVTRPEFQQFFEKLEK